MLFSLYLLNINSYNDLKDVKYFEIDTNLEVNNK